MELDEEPEDTHGYQPSGFLNPLTLPEAKGYPSSRFPNLYGMVTHMGIHTGEFSEYVHHPVTRPASPLHHYSESVTMASHTGISVSATLVVVISSLDYTQNYQASAPLTN